MIEKALGDVAKQIALSALRYGNTQMQTNSPIDAAQLVLIVGQRRKAT